MSGIQTEPPRRYALPIHPQPRSEPARVAQVVHEENRLRRKTPFGTLAAGYDASSDGHPQKYQVTQKSSFGNGKPTFAEHQQRQEQLARYSFAYTTPRTQLPVMDSLLNQDMTYTAHNIHSIPSVLQPSFQHVPTAPGLRSQMPYGPYHYDGTFAPYRPAAVQDPRFYHFHHSPWPHCSRVWSPHYNQAISPLAVGWTHAPSPAASLHSPWTQSPSSTIHDFQQPAVPVSQSPQIGLDDYENRDVIHAWCLQRYRDLLSYLNRVRKQTLPPHKQQPRFYPKPPVRQRRQSEGGTANDVSPADQIMSHDIDQTDIARRQSFPWSPNGLRMHDNEYQRRASHDQYHRQSYAGLTPTSIQSSVQPHGQDDSAYARASLALARLNDSCQKSHWKWVDGMHLGGCIAYGLGNYITAARWYEKVLENDEGHLEATSNLAAAYLALGRPAEAEQFWIRVVKAAPNHFEAVEHLLGLLCTSNRSDAAVQVIEYVEHVLRQTKDRPSPSSGPKRPSTYPDFDIDATTFVHDWRGKPEASEPGFGSSGFAIPGCENGRILALIHAKGNIYYTMGNVSAAAKAFEAAVLVATGRMFNTVQQLVDHVLHQVAAAIQAQRPDVSMAHSLKVDPILLSPEQALATSRICFQASGSLPALQYVPGDHQSIARRAVISTTSNSLLSLAKIYQDSMSNVGHAPKTKLIGSGVRSILALYYLSLSLQPSPSTANNVGILLAGVQQVSPLVQPVLKMELPGVIAGSGISLALQYYNYGLQLDMNHAHLYTNLGSLLKDIGQLDAAISMYERAVKCDPRFDIALANLANAVKDKGRTSDAITYYKRAVDANPQFAEAVCGLANALNSVCNWQGRGGLVVDSRRRDRWHVDGNGMLIDARQPDAQSSGWLKHVVDIVDKQLADGESWGRGIITDALIQDLVPQLLPDRVSEHDQLRQQLRRWAGKAWEGARLVRLIERAARYLGWLSYQQSYGHKRSKRPVPFARPRLPSGLSIPSAPTVLPFHAFTTPLSASQIRRISQRNGVRISALSLKAPWLSQQIATPPPPPAPFLKVGYVSSDFNNHPLAHLMQSVFGLHDRGRVLAHCYATTASDGSVHRRQIEQECPVFHDAGNWPIDKLVKQIHADGIHILVNLNGYTRGARNEVFAARPAPLLMSFMGFAGTLGAEWCDYLLADTTTIPTSSLRSGRRNLSIQDQFTDGNYDDGNDWIYGENVIYCRDTFFCCDHKQSATKTSEREVTWHDEQQRRWKMRRELFPQLPDHTIIFGNFNQLYKIDPTTFRSWLRVLARVPNSILWLLRFPDLGESHLRATAKNWAGSEVASRILFTDVAAKHLHISRTTICDLVLDTPECNAHTTAADVLWSGTPLLTFPRYEYKMCSRIAASILKGALPKDEHGRRAAEQLIATSDADYEERAVALASGFRYHADGTGRAEGRLMELRELLFKSRWSSGLFDTARWVRDLEDGYEEAWRRYVAGEGGDIWLDKIPSRGSKGQC